MTTIVNNPKSTVVQLPSYSRYKNVNKVSNAEWEVSIATQNIAINQGDSVVVKNVFLDTRNIGSNIISFDADFEIEIDMYHYIMMDPSMYSNPQYRFVAGTLQQWKGVGNPPTVYGTNMTGVQGTNQPIAIEIPLALMYYNSRSTKTTMATHKFKKVFPKGNYSPSELSLAMNKLFSKLPDILIQNTLSTFNNSIESDISSGVAFLNGTIGANGFGDYTTYDATTNSHIAINSKNSDETPFFCEFLKDRSFPTDFNTLGTTFQNPLCINCFQTTIAEPFVDLGDVVGTNQFSIIFDEQANIFKFDYTHMPISVPVERIVTSGNSSNSTVQFGAPVEAVLLCATMNDSNVPNMCKYSKHSGVLFKSLKPESFFRDILGFDLNNLLVNDDDIFNRTITYEKFNNITTDGLTSASMLFDSSTPHFDLNAVDTPLTSYLYKNLTAPPLGGQTTSPFISGGSGVYSNLSLAQIINGCSDSDNKLPFMQFPLSSIGNRTINAIKPPTSELETGHYLIEITGYQSEFISPSELMNIKAIVSSYYQSQSSFVSLPFSDSYTYVHNSPVPLVLSNLKIRVLNPITLQPVTGLGANNAVYLQINRNIQPTQIS